MFIVIVRYASGPISRGSIIAAAGPFPTDHDAHRFDADVPSKYDTEVVEVSDPEQMLEEL